MVSQFSLKRLQLRKLLDRDHRLVRHGRARIHQHIVGREIGRVIAELAREAQSLLAAEVNVNRRGRKHIENDELRCKKLFQHFPKSRVTQPGT